MGKVRVMMLGLRGFPQVQGGIETHAEHLCQELQKQGSVEVSSIVRSRYMRHYPGKDYKGIRLHRIWSPSSSRLETIVHTLLGVLYAGLINRPDILHIHAVGPSLMVPLARLLGLKVVMTHHGPDYDRQKWGKLARISLRLGEKFGVIYANKTVVISRTIQDQVKAMYGVDTVRIANGVSVFDLQENKNVLESFKVNPGRYILMVTRLVPEKRHLDVIEAFAKSKLKDWQLVIVGNADHEDDYARKVLKKAAMTPRVIMPGKQTGDALAQFYSHAGLFILPSSHEGMPIALLEALSFGLPVLASDIPPHLELELGEECYFPLGDTKALANSFNERCVPTAQDDEKKSEIRSWVSEKYNWRDVATQTRYVYEDITGGGMGVGKKVLDHSM